MKNIRFSVGIILKESFINQQEKAFFEVRPWLASRKNAFLFRYFTLGGEIFSYERCSPVIKDTNGEFYKAVPLISPHLWLKNSPLPWNGHPCSGSR